MKNIQSFSSILVFSFVFLIGFVSLQTSYSQTAQEHYKEGNQAFHSQNYTLAMQQYKRAIQKDNQYAAAYHNLGNVYYLMNDYSAALENYSFAIKANSNEAEPYASRGALYLGLRKYTEAAQDLDKALALNPHFTNGYYMRGELYEASRQIEKACASWRKAAEMGHEPARQKIIKYCGEDAVKGLARSEDSLSMMPSEAQDYIRLGEQKMERRNYEGAVRDFDKAIKKDPKLGKAYFGRGAAKFAMGKQNEACEDWYLALRHGYKQAAEMLEGCGE